MKIYLASPFFNEAEIEVYRRAITLLRAEGYEAKGQGIISVNSGAQAANTKITVYGTGDMELISVRPELDFEVVIICGPELVKGETYKVTVGDLSGSFVAK